jgi:hypothetical protein
MTKHIASTVTDSGILLFVDGARYVIGNDHPNFGKIKDAIGRGDYDSIADLADIRSAVRKWMNNGSEFALTDDLIHLNGLPFSEAVTDKVLAMIDAGNTADPLFNFLRKVRENPAKHAQDELLLFCVANGFMIHEDGDVLAYKSVRGDYTDIHSGKFRNAVGDVVEMPRFQVDDKRENTCSTGLHFASHEYASTWAGAIDGDNRRLMVMKIHPKDVVSIPVDYNNQKGRCARYEVIAELGGNPLPKREVYTDEDLGRTPSVNEWGRTPAEQRVVDEMDRLIDSLYDTLSDREDEAEGLQERIDQIESLGGDSSAVQDDLDRVNDDIYALQCEIDDLTNERENS